MLNLRFIASTLCWLPFSLPFNSAVWPQQYREAAAVALISIGALLLQKRNASSLGAPNGLSIPLPNLVLIFFALIVLVQHFLGMLVYFQQLVYPLITSLLLMQSVSLGVMYSGEERKAVVTSIALGLLVASAIQTLFAAFQVFEMVNPVSVAEGRREAFRSVGLLAQSNHLAVVFSWGVAGAFYLHYSGRMRLVNLIWILVLLLFMLSTTGSKAVWLYMTCCGLIFPPILFRTACRNWWLPLLLVPGLWVSDVLVSSSFGALGLPVDTVLMRSQSDSTTSIRLALYWDALELALTSPLLGVGFGQFMSARMDMPMAHLVEPYATHAHNLVLHLAAELGLGVAALACGGLAWVAWRLIGFCQTLDEKFVGILVAIIAIYSLLEFPLWFTYFSLPTAFFVGLMRPPIVKLRGLDSVATLLAKFQVVMLGVIIFLFSDLVRVDTLIRGVNEGRRWSSDLSEVILSAGWVVKQMELEHVYLTTTPPDDTYFQWNSDVSRRVVAVKPTPIVVGVRAVHLVGEGDVDAAQDLVANTCRWSQEGCEATVTYLRRVVRRMPQEKYRIFVEQFDAVGQR